MFLADSNIWLSLAVADHTFHPSVEDWLPQQTPQDPVCFCRSTQQSFLRLLTTSAVVAPYGTLPLSNIAAWATYEAFLEDGRIAWLDEPHGLERHSKKCSDRRGPSPKLWMDAYLAAFAIAGKHKFVTTDKAFKQYKGLDVLVLPSG